MKDPIVESVIKSFRDRSARGIEKYGTTLADNPLSLLEWMQHLSEELQDAILYLERMKKDISDSAVGHRSKTLADKPIFHNYNKWNI